MINNSEPVGSTGWFQGNSAAFPAHAGADTAYIAANFNNTGGVGTISNWLLTPEVDLEYDTEFRFWTRRATGSTFPDRLEVRLSTAGGSTDVGDSAETVGDFPELLLEINPDLEAGGYPQAWTEFVVTVDGLGAATTGRFAFRYYVTNAGPTGTNADYIGIDTVTLTQLTVQPAPVSGWRLLSVPGFAPSGPSDYLTVQDLAGLNLVQGVTGSYPGATPNLLVNYVGPTSDDYTAASSTDQFLFPGRGFFWYLYDDADFAGTPPPEFVDIEAFQFPIAFGEAPTVNVNVGFGGIPVGGDPAPYMLGNPFQAAFDVEGVVLSGGDGTLQTNFYSWDPASQTYVTRTAGDSVNVWEGFWAEVVGGTSVPVFTMDIAFVASLHEATPGGSAGVTGPAETSGEARGAPALNLQLRGTLDTGAPVTDLANGLRFEEDAMLGWDRHDGSKFMPPPAMASYALLALEGVHDGTPYRQAVRSLPSGLDEAVTIATDFLTTGGGEFTISATPEGMPEGWSVTLRDLQTDAVTNLLNESYAFTAAGGADWQDRFRITVTPAGVIGTDKGPAPFRLSNATPNPAIGSTALVFRVDDAQRVTARVFDALGRTVATVHEGTFAAGEEVRLEVDTSTLAAGTYVVRVVGETFAETRRFAVIR